MKQNDFQKVANQVSFVTIVVNILLSFMKLLAGVFAHSNAMISDSIHSASDVFSTMIVVIGIKLSSKQPTRSTRMDMSGWSVWLRLSSRWFSL